MSPARTWTLLSCAVLVATSPSCAPTGQVYETPEGAAYAFAGDYADAVNKTPHRAKRADSVLYVNVPPDARVLDSSLQRDLHPYAHRLRLFRDSSQYAQARVPQDSLSVYGRLVDIRPIDSSTINYLRKQPGGIDERLLRRGQAYLVAAESCRQWRCHGAIAVVVGHTRRGYRGLGVLYSVTE